ncbi:MAG: hypothetical protein HY908_23205, partial [Myxococcales bacterium]|nr:hypothetical protein [Myxococcales bacterium]
MTPIGRLHWLALGAALGLPALGCDGCFGLDKYELVPSASTSSTSGTGGSTPSCPTPATTMLFATYPLAPGSGDPAGDACATPSASAPGGGLALVALGPDDGACLARTDIARPAGGSLEALARVSAGPASAFLVAARYRGGAVTLPPSCADSTPTVVDEAPGASDGLFVARVTVTGTELCTRWVRRVYTTAPGARIVVGALDGAASGPVALAGALDGAVGHFEDGPATTDATGGAFVARYDENGALEGVSTFGSAADTALGLARYETGWLVSGGVRAADPACHGCSGETNLTAVRGSCQGGAGGAAGAGGAG